MGRKGMLPVQKWDEINVSHERVQSPQKVEMVSSKETKQLVKEMKKQNRLNKRKRK